MLRMENKGVKCSETICVFLTVKVAQRDQFDQGPLYIQNRNVSFDILTQPIHSDTADRNIHGCEDTVDWQKKINVL